MVNEIMIFNFGDARIEGVNTSDGIALSDEQIGIALGYSDPAKDVARLVSRNSVELDGLSTCVKMTQVEGGREVERSVRIWSERGVMAITFLAKTAKAIVFRMWARETLYLVRKSKSYVPPRDPLNAVDQLASAMQGIMTQFMPALSSKVIEVENAQVAIGDRLDAVEVKQRLTDPRVIETHMFALHQIKRLLVAGTKDSAQPVTQQAFWRSLKDHLKIGSFQNRAALDVLMMDKAIAFAGSWCFSRGIKPPDPLDGQQGDQPVPQGRMA
jgi:prophage antirepressor-like protein